MVGALTVCMLQNFTLWAIWLCKHTTCRGLGDTRCFLSVFPDTSCVLNCTSCRDMLQCLDGSSIVVNEFATFPQKYIRLPINSRKKTCLHELKSWFGFGGFERWISQLLTSTCMLPAVNDLRCLLCLKESCWLHPWIFGQREGNTVYMPSQGLWRVSTQISRKTFVGWCCEESNEIKVEDEPDRIECNSTQLPCATILWEAWICWT